MQALVDLTNGMCEAYEAFCLFSPSLATFFSLRSVCCCHASPSKGPGEEVGQDGLEACVEGGYVSVLLQCTQPILCQGVFITLCHEFWLVCTVPHSRDVVLKLRRGL